MELKVGDLVLILPPEDFGLDKDELKYGIFWNSRPTAEDKWLGNDLNMDDFINKIGVVGELVERDSNKGFVKIKLHAIYGVSGEGWIFNSKHIKLVENPGG